MRLSPLVVLLVPLAATGGCTTETGAVASRLQECGVLSAGEVGSLPTQFYVPDGCYAGCYASASCEELTQTYCGESIELSLRCDRRCAYRCPDGALLRPDQRCDGIESCEDGADEAGCADPPADRCERATVCDGRTECADGSDERDCPPYVCANGQEVWRHARCDGWAACGDRSDEEGCATADRSVCAP